MRNQKRVRSITAAMRNIVFDTTTNTSFIQGRDGTAYTVEQVAAADATPTDPASRALLANIDYPDSATMEELLHDCPECRAAMARGEVPHVEHPGRFTAARPLRFAKRPRWRSMKKRH